MLAWCNYLESVVIYPWQVFRLSQNGRFRHLMQLCLALHFSMWESQMNCHLGHMFSASSVMSREGWGFKTHFSLRLGWIFAPSVFCLALCGICYQLLILNILVGLGREMRNHAMQGQAALPFTVWLEGDNQSFVVMPISSLIYLVHSFTTEALARLTELIKH